MALPQYPIFDSDLGSAAYNLPPIPPPQPQPPPPRPPLSLAANVGHSLAGGLMVDFPTMAGQALRAFSPEEGTLADMARGWEASAAERAKQPEYQGEPGVISTAARGVGSLAPALALNAIPGVGSGLSAATLGAMFGGAGYTSMKEEALKAGATPEVAQRAGLEEGGLQGVLQTVGGGILGRVLRGAGPAAASMLLKKGGGQAVLDGFKNPAVFKPFALGAMEAIGANTLLQGGIAAGSAAIAHEAGIEGPSSWEAAKSSFAPTALMTTMLAPFGMFGARALRNAKEQVADMVQKPASDKLAPDQLNVWKEARLKAITRIARQMRQFSPEDADAWQTEAGLAVQDNLPIELDVNFKAADAKARAEAAKAAPQEEGRPPFELTGGQPQPFELTPPGEQPAQPEAGRQGEMDLRPQGQGELELLKRAEGEPKQLALPGIEGEQGFGGRKPPPEEPPGGGGGTTEGQGTLDLRTDEERRNDTMETRNKIVRRELGQGVPKDVRDRLTTIDDPQALPQALWEVWSDKGGNGAEAKYVEKIGDLYKKITGKDIEDHVGVIDNAKPREAATENRAGTEPQSAAVQANAEAPRVGEQVGEAKGNGAPGEQAGGNAQAVKEVTPQPTGVENALTTGKSDREINQGTEGARVAPALAEANRGDSGVGSPQEGQGGSQAEIAKLSDAQYSKLLSKQIAKHDADIELTKKRLGSLTRAEAARVASGGKPSTQLYAKKQQFEKQIGELNARRQELLKENSRVDAKRFPLGEEPSEKRSYYDDLKTPLDPEKGLTQPGSFDLRGAEHGGGEITSNLMKLQKYLEAKILAGRASADEKAMHAGLGGFKGTSKSRETAVQALSSLPKGEDAKYNALATRFKNVMKTATQLGTTARESEKAVAKSAGDYLMSKDELLQAVEAVHYNRVNGTISDAQAHKALEDLKYSETYDRRLKEFDDPGLMDAVKANPNAQSVMEHLAKNHPNALGRAIAKMLANSGVTAQIRPAWLPSIIGAAYHPAMNTIYVGRGGMNALTLMHETWHAATHAALRRGLDALARQTASLVGAGRAPVGSEPRNEIQAYYRLADRSPTFSPKQKAEMDAALTVRSVMDQFSRVADLDNPSHRIALKDEHEFLAEANSNPEIAKLLGGRRGALQKIWDAFAKVFDWNAEQRTDFERLQDAARELMGPPDRSMDIMQRPYAVGEEADMTSPVGAMRMANHAFNQLDGVGDKLVRHFSDFKNEFKKNFLGYTTLNNTIQLTERAMRIVDREPGMEGFKPFTDAFRPYYQMYRATVQVMKGQRNLLLNGESEGQDFLNRHHTADSVNRAEKKQMDRVMLDANVTGVFPWAKSLTEAQKLNSQVTPERFAKAQRNNAAWSRLSPEAQTLAKSTYEHYQLEHARYGSEAVRQHVFYHKATDASPGLRAAFDGLAWENHREDPATHQVRPETEQTARILQGIKTLQSELDKVVGTEEKPSTNPLARQAEGAQTTSSHFMDQFYKEHERPYVPSSREGTYFIKAEVGGGAAEWARVRRIVTEELNTGNGGGTSRHMVEDPVEGNRDLFMKFDSHLDYRQAVDALQQLRDDKLFHNKDGQSTWADGNLADKTRKITGTSGRFMDQLASRVREDPDLPDEAKDHVVRTMYDSWLQMMPETSPLKAHMQADNTAGNMGTLTHAMANRTQAHILQLTSMRSAMGMTDALTGIERARTVLNKVDARGDMAAVKDRFGAYISEMNKRAAQMQTEVVGYSKGIQNVKSLTALWDLALSPAYMLMVGYQPWQISVPGIGKTYGMGKTAMSMAKNTAMSWSILKQVIGQGWAKADGNSTFDKLNRVSDIAINARKIKLRAGGDQQFNEQQLDLINGLVGTGLVNFGMAAQLYRNSPNDMGVMSKAQRIAQIAPHFIEMSNRLATALTAHEMAIGSGKEHNAAKEYAYQIIRDTDGDHSQLNIARNLGQRGKLGQVTPLVVGFGQYDIQMSEFLIRQGMELFGKGSTPAERLEAAKGLSGIAVMTAGIAGTLGLPFAGLATGAWNAAKQVFQDEGSDPPDAEHAWRMGMNSIFGEKGGEIVSRGVPRALGFDMSGRSGYQDLFPFTGFLTDRAKMQDRFANGAFHLAGPSAGIIAGLAEGAESAYHGNYPLAINQALPAAVRNLSKAYRLSQYGEERVTGKNTPLTGIDPSGWDVFMRSAGFTSSAKAEYTEANYQFHNMEEILKARRQVIQNEMLRAAARGDNEALQNAAQRALRFAMQQPRFNPLASIGQGIAAQRKEQVVGGMPGMHGVQVQPNEIRYFQQFQHGGSVGRPENLPTF